MGAWCLYNYNMNEDLMKHVTELVENSEGHIIEKSIVEEWDGDTITEINTVKWTMKYAKIMGGGRHRLAAE